MPLGICGLKEVYIMEKIDRRVKGVDLFKLCYNCSQAVIFAIDDVLPIDRENLLKITGAFGGGFARTRNLCGTVTGMGMVLGLLHKDGDDVEENKKHLYGEVRKLTDKFVEKNGFLNCGDLLKNIKGITDGYVPDKRTEEYYKVRPCVKFVYEAIEILEEYIRENGLADLD